MLIIFIRTTIIFLTLMLVMRLMGKRQIGEMQPFEFIITLIIADLACVPMSDVSIPLVYGIIAILALFVLHQLMFLIESSGSVCKKIISGKPSVIINKMGVDLKELKKNALDIDDLIESMRAMGYFSLDDLDYAIFEANGKLSALEKEGYLEAPPALPVLVVDDGKIKKDAVKKAGLTEKFITDILEKQKATLKQTEVMTIDNNGKIYFQKKNNPYEILNVELPKEAQW